LRQSLLKITITRVEDVICPLFFQNLDLFFPAHDVYYIYLLWRQKTVEHSTK